MYEAEVDADKERPCSIAHSERQTLFGVTVCRDICDRLLLQLARPALFSDLIVITWLGEIPSDDIKS
jgi:hypothetical protein